MDIRRRWGFNDDPPSNGSRKPMKRMIRGCPGLQPQSNYDVRINLTPYPAKNGLLKGKCIGVMIITLKKDCQPFFVIQLLPLSTQMERGKSEG